MRVDRSELRGQRSDLLRYVERRVDDVSLSEDIVQEAFARLFAYQVKPGNAVLNVGAFLRRISLNLTRDHFRRARATSLVEITEDVPCSQPGIHHRLEQRQLVELVEAALRAMPRLRRDVFIRRRVYGESAKEVASALSLSPGAVDTHVARAVLDLHRAMDKVERRGEAVTG